MKKLVDLLHLLLCSSKHEHEMMQIAFREKKICYYYLESDIAEGEAMPDHIKWESVTNNFKHALNFSSDEEAWEFAKKSVELAGNFRNLTKNEEERKNFILSLLA